MLSVWLGTSLSIQDQAEVYSVDLPLLNETDLPVQNSP